MARKGFKYEMELTERGLCVQLLAVGRPDDEDFARVAPLLELARKSVEDERIDLCLDVSDCGNAALSVLCMCLASHPYRRVAIVGEGDWHRWCVQTAIPIVSAPLHYFDSKVAAMDWLS